jgi:hypothetical protein
MLRTPGRLRPRTTSSKKKPAISADRASALLGRLATGTRIGDREIASVKRKVPLVGTGYPPRIEQYVCYMGRLAGYESHGIGRQIRKTQTRIEGSGNARRRRTAGPLARPLWHEAPQKIHRSLLIAAVAHRMRENALGALKSSRRPTFNTGFEQLGDSPTLTPFPESKSESRNRVGARLRRGHPSGKGTRRRHPLSQQTIQVTIRGRTRHHRLALVGTTALPPQIHR